MNSIGINGSDTSRKTAYSECPSAFRKHVTESRADWHLRITAYTVLDYSVRFNQYEQRSCRFVGGLDLVFLFWTAEANNRTEKVTTQSENPFSKLIPDQTFAVIPQFDLESGGILHNVPVAYKTYGTLAPSGDNAMVICHALTGSADVGDWWGPLLGGSGKAFDISRFFVVCMNSLGSPYGSASPVTAKDGDALLGLYGPEFPLTTVRDDVK